MLIAIEDGGGGIVDLVGSRGVGDKISWQKRSLVKSR